MTTDQMMYFVEIANQRSISKAANRLHISQPSLSAALKRMEEELNVQLVWRSGKGVELTETGKRIYEDCIHVLATVKTWYAEDNDGGSGEIRIAVSPANGEVIFDFLLNHFCKRDPQPSFIFSEETPPCIETMILSREADIFITSILPEEDTRFCNIMEKMDLELWELMKDELVLAIDAKHPFAARKCISLEECKTLTLIQRVERDLVAEKFCGYFASGRRILHSNRETVLHMVSSGKGVTFLPKALLCENRRFVAHEISTVAIEETIIPITHIMVSGNRKARTRVQNDVIELIRMRYQEIGEEH